MRQTQLSSTQKITKSKKRRHRRKSKGKTNDLTKNKDRGVDRDQLQSQAQDIPIDAHSIPESVKSPTPSVTLADTDLVIVKDHIDINVDDDPNVYYLERSDIPGVCVESRETSSWTPIKISRSRVRAADSDTSDDNVFVDDCLSLNYQPVHGVPGFEVETADDIFWAPTIAHRTRARVRLKFTDI